MTTLKAFNSDEVLELIKNKNFGEVRTYDLKNADLHNADLRKVNLSDVDFQGANLIKADLSWANLSGANLSYANLRDANLSYANLRGANLTGADLRGANIHNATIYSVNLCEANLDFSSWPLSCGSFNVKSDIKLAAQLAYHFCRLDCDDAEYIRIRNGMVDFANKFRVCGNGGCEKLDEK